MSKSKERAMIAERKAMEARIAEEARRRAEAARIAEITKIAEEVSWEVCRNFYMEVAREVCTEVVKEIYKEELTRHESTYNKPTTEPKITRVQIEPKGNQMEPKSLRRIPRQAYGEGYTTNKDADNPAEYGGSPLMLEKAYSAPQNINPLSAGDGQDEYGGIGWSDEYAGDEWGQAESGRNDEYVVTGQSSE